MATPVDEILEKRLAALERQNRWLKGIGFVGVTILAVGLLMGANKPDKIVGAERFVVKDEKGITRAEFGMTDMGPSLLLRDEAGMTRVRLDLYDSRSAGLDLYDEKGNRRVCLSAFKEGSNFWLFDEPGKPRVMVGVDKRGPRFELADEACKTRASLALDKHGPFILLDDEAGRLIWKAP